MSQNGRSKFRLSIIQFNSQTEEQHWMNLFKIYIRLLSQEHFLLNWKQFSVNV